MSKRRKTKVFSFQGFDLAHYKATEAYTRAVSALFDKATDDIANAASRENYNPDKPFSFDDYPKAKAQLQKTIKGLAGKMQAVIETASRKQWLFACQKNDEFIASIFDTTKLTKGQLKKYQDRNLDALQSFQQRKVGGMDLSERVWKYTQQYKEQIEAGLDVGLGEGRSAQQLSRDLRQNLKDPNRLFRRVRDKRGNLQLSKSAKAFHPGQGVYRSSYKNAMRLARSEINMSYRESDHLRWQQLDFVLGFEVRRSNREPKCNCELCERLVGRYPKWFKFKGWHPQCLCDTKPILEDFYSKERSDDRVARMRAALRGEEYKKYVSKGLIKDLPDNFKEWEQWVLFMLKGIEETAVQTIELIKHISSLMAEYKRKLRPLFGRLYKHELINNLFFHPYTKIEYMQKDMMVQRKTATKYLDRIVEAGLLRKMKFGRSNYYINTKLMDLFIHHRVDESNDTESIESVRE